MTPPDFEGETVYEYCDDCDKKFEPDELHNVLIELESFTLCNKCKNKAEQI
jgi:NAD-dependent SIR2 family protein deacetylase